MLDCQDIVELAVLLAGGEKRRSPKDVDSNVSNMQKRMLREKARTAPKYPAGGALLSGKKAMRRRLHVESQSIPRKAWAARRLTPPNSSKVSQTQPRIAMIQACTADDKAMMLADKSVFSIAHIYDGGRRWQKKRTRMEGVEADHVGGTIKLTVEPILDGVHDDDRMNVRNVIYLLDALKLCQSWSVTSKDQGYEVLGSVDTKAGKTTEIVLKDLELITKVDPLRVTSAGVRFIGGGHCMWWCSC